MHENEIGSRAKTSIVHYAIKLVEARERRDRAWKSGSAVEYGAAKRKEHSAGLDLDRAVRQARPP